MSMVYMLCILFSRGQPSEVYLGNDWVIRPNLTKTLFWCFLNINGGRWGTAVGRQYDTHCAAILFKFGFEVW
jgi:hypothetical protein